MSSNDDEVLVRVESVSKKFCRSLKKSLWYGVCDIGAELNPFRRRVAEVAGSELRVAREEAEVAGSELLVASGNTSAEGASGPATSYPPLVTSPTGEASLRDGEFFAVKDVSFELRRGECLGLIGHNGAGKTTLLKMLNGLIKPDRGTITMRGRVGALIALGAGFNPILTGRENIYINGSVLGLTKKEIDEKIDEIIDFAEIREFIDMPVQSYSSGMTVRLGFAVATALDPDVLIVDEVLAVGDFQFRWKCLDRIKKLKQSGVSILLVSHNAADLVRTCDIGILMGKGCAQFVGEINACLREYELTAPKSLQPQRGQANGGATIERTQLSLVGDDSSQGLLVRMEIVAKSRIEKCRIIVGISHSLGGNLFNVSSCWNGEWMMLEQGRNFVELKLTGFALQTGTCSLEVSLRGEELKDIYDLGRSQLHISETSPDYEGYGINGALRPECHWRVGRFEVNPGVAA